MQLSQTDDQSAILDAIDGLARPYTTMPASAHGFTLTSEALDAELRQGGFLDVGFDPDLGPVTAALVVERLAKLPYAVEAAASALVRPLIGELAGPVCLVERLADPHPVRFLRAGATVVTLHVDRVSTLVVGEEDVRPVESLFAYPIAMLKPADHAARLEARDVAVAAVKARWRVGLAIEVAGLLDAAIAATVTYVSERKQFGRPIGTFQALRHRLAEDHVLALGTRWLALKAAASGDEGDAALAAAHAQEAARQVVYDLHQFLGGMGVTLEHPLHLWTYRLKLLTADLGGGLVQAADAAALVWPNRAAA
jgi:hypothetical protein